jgi:hypothetical protein
MVIDFLFTYTSRRDGSRRYTVISSHGPVEVAKAYVIQYALDNKALVNPQLVMWGGPGSFDGLIAGVVGECESDWRI